MSANPTNLELVLDLYAGIPDGQIGISHDPKDKWRITIVQMTKYGHHITRAFGVGGTVEDAADAAAEDYYDRIDREII